MKFIKDQEAGGFLSHLGIRTPLSNKLDKTYVQDDMLYGDFKDLPRRTASVKKLLDKGINIAKNSKYYGRQQSVASFFLDFF